MNMGVWLIKMMMIVIIIIIIIIIIVVVVVVVVVIITIIIIIIIIIIINNCIAKWRLGAWDIQELSLLVASYKVETAPMAGKSWKPSQELPPRRGK